MLTSHLESVDERAKRTGYLGGPNNRMLRPDAMSPAAKAEPAPQPNYRPGEMGHECLDCAHFDMPNRMCLKYNAPAKPDMVCDDFVDKDAEEPGERSHDAMNSGVSDE